MIQVRTLTAVIKIVQYTNMRNICLVSARIILKKTVVININIQRLITAILSVLFIAHVILIAIHIISAAKIMTGLNLKGFIIRIFFLKYSDVIVAKNRIFVIARRKCLKLVTSCTHKGGNSCNNKRKHTEIFRTIALNDDFLSDKFVI